MKYKLYENATNNLYGNIVQDVLRNRGIANPQEYLDIENFEPQDFSCLNNIQEAGLLFKHHFDKKNKIAILVDDDADGFCSASMMYSYIQSLSGFEHGSEYPVEYILHKRAKAHGLTEDVEIPEDINLLIIPDAGTNDTKQCKELMKKNIDVLILDHHEKEKDNPFAVVVNNQISKFYHNKDFCGAGIVYRFLEGLDDLYWYEMADDYIDLCAIANISDNMDMRSMETKYYVNQGLKCISNQFIFALLKAQEFSTKGIINIHNISWYITPVINGCIRYGSFEEKDLMFRAFIHQYEEFEYKKPARGGNPSQIVIEDIYTRAARLAKNAKSRQDKRRDAAEKLIAENHMIVPTDKVALIDVTNIIDSSLTGVVAIKIAEKYGRPCILVKEYFNEETQSYVYKGSARNIDNSPIESFKDVINDTSSFTLAQGHANAFGVELPKNALFEAYNELNEKLKNVEFDASYKVDYILNFDDGELSTIVPMCQMTNLIGQGIEDVRIAIENIPLTVDDMQLMGKNDDTIKIQLNGIELVMFKCKPDNPLIKFYYEWEKKYEVICNIVGRPCFNDYGGNRHIQVVIDDIEVLK